MYFPCIKKPRGAKPSLTSALPRRITTAVLRKVIKNIMIEEFEKTSELVWKPIFWTR